MYGPVFDKKSPGYKSDQAHIVCLPTDTTPDGRITDDRDQLRCTDVDQVKSSPMDSPPTSSTLQLHPATLPPAKGPVKVTTPQLPSRRPTKSVKSVVPKTVDTQETSKVLPSSVAGFGKVVETTRVQARGPAPVFSPEITKSFATTRLRRTIHPLEEPSPPLTPLALTPKLGQPQACSSPFGGAVLFGT